MALLVLAKQLDDKNQNNSAAIMDKEYANKQSFEELKMKTEMSLWETVCLVGQDLMELCHGLG